MKFLSFETVDVECPRCRTKFVQRLAGLVPGKVTACPRCGARVTFTAEDLERLRESLDRVTREDV